MADATPRDREAGSVAGAPASAPQPRRGRLVLRASAIAVLLVLVSIAAWVAVTWSTGEPADPGHDPTMVSALAFSGDGQVLGVGMESGLVSLWRVADGQPLASLMPRVTPIDSLALNHDASLVAMGFRFGIVAFWDQARQAEIGFVNLVPPQAADPPGNPACLSFQPGGRVILCLDADYNLLRFVDLATGSQYDPVRFGPRRVASASLSNTDQRFLALGHAESGTVEVFDLLARTSLGVVSGEGAAVHATAIAPDGERVAAVETGGRFSVWAVRGGARLASFDGPAPLGALAFSPDGRLIAGGGQGSVVIWDATTARERHRLDLSTAPPA